MGPSSFFVASCADQVYTFARVLGFERSLPEACRPYLNISQNAFRFIGWPESRDVILGRACSIVFWVLLHVLFDVCRQFELVREKRSKANGNKLSLYHAAVSQ